MKYIICHPREINSTAHRFTNQLLSDGGSLSVVLECMLSTGASNIQYTRSLALAAKRIIENLKSKENGMATLFQKEIGDMSLAIFIRHFMVICRSPRVYFFAFAHSELKDAFERGTDETHLDDNIVPSVMPLAISAFIGDLTSLGLITFTAFDACMGFLMKRVRTRLHIRCLQYLLGHAGARHLPQITLSYVRDCARVVRSQAEKHLQCYSLEEDELRDLMKDIVTRPIGAYFRQEWDRRLDLELALQASVVHSPADNYCTLSTSPDGSESVSSAPTNSFPGSPQSKASSLTMSPVSSVDSAKSADEATKGKAAAVSHTAPTDDAYSPYSDKDENGETAARVDDETSVSLVIHAPRPIRPAQAHLWLWLY